MLRRSILLALACALTLAAAGCGSSHPRPIGAVLPPPVGQDACLAARSSALEILAKALHGGVPASAQLSAAERRAAATLRVAARRISELQSAAGTQAGARSLVPALVGSARRLGDLARRTRGPLPADALAQYSTVGEMVYDACA